MKRVYSLLSAVLAFVACQNVGLETDSSEVVEGNSGQEFKEVIITASIADGQQVSRTTYNEDEAKNYWTPGDKIKVFSAGYTSEFTSINTAPAPVVNFKGVVTFISGSSNDDDDSKYYVWGLYPYSDEAVYEEPDGISRTARITTTYPDAQVGVAGTFGDGLSVMIGRSESLSIPFKGAYSGAFFQVSRDDIVSMTLRGLNGETLAGTATIGLNSALTPVVHSVADPKESVTVTAPNGTFEPGVNYYLVTLPDVALPDGYSVTLERSDGSYGTYEVRANRPLNRIKFRNLSEPVDVRIENENNIANGTSTGWMRPDGNIVFADPKVKSICVENWDTDGDGELSYTEAAAVKTIPYGVFSGEDITSFDEFQYFTEVTKLEYDSDYDEGYEYYGAFSFSSLKSIKLPSSLKTISFGAFSGCGQLEEITIPATVTSIGMSAFHACPGLTVHMESATPCSMFRDAYGTWDEPYAFGNQFMGGTVKVIYVPDEAAAAAYKSAQYWSTYSTIIHPEGWVDPSDIITFQDEIAEMYCVDKWDTNGDGKLSKGEAAAVTDIETTFQGVDISSFDEFKYFTGVTAIPQDAFKNCKYLESISFPAQITTFSSAFSGCSLNRVTIPSLDLWYAGLYGMRFSKVDLYVDDELLTEVTVPALYSGYDYIFYGVKSLKSVIIEDGATSIGNYAFYGCSGLTHISIPDGITSVKGHAFQGCSSLTTISIPESVQSLGYSPSVSDQGSVFQDCSSLESVDLPTSVKTYYGSAMFAGCSNLLNVTIPEGATSISSSFSGCTNLISVTIPESVKRTGGWTFENCASLESLVLPEGLEELGQTISSSYYPIISGCSKLKDISLPSSIISVAAGALDGSGIEKVEIYPNMLENSGLISSYNFYKVSRFCAAFASLSLVKERNYYHVYYGPKIVIIKKSSITYSVPDDAFRYCFSLESITLPNGLTSVGRTAFMNDYLLKSIIFPSTLKDIKNEALSGCSGLESITFLSTTPPTLGSNALSTNNCPIYVPAGCVDLYKSADGWSAYADRIQCDPSQVVHVSDVSLNASSMSLAVGTTSTLIPTVSPSNATDKSVTWTTSNSSVATVDAQGVVTAVSSGTATITVTTSDGGHMAACEVTVRDPFPEGTSFDPDAYITYVSNHQEWGNLSTEQDYMYDTQFSADVSGTRIEMKFQIPDYSSGEAILSQGLHLGNGLAIDASNVYQVRFVGKHKDGDTWYDQAFDSGVGSGIDGTGVVVLTASCDGNQIVASVNGNETTIPVAVSSWSFNYLFSYYDYEGGDGSKDEYLAGVPDGAKLYYVKIWNGDDLVYFGHASRSVCSFSSEEEYCWYEEVGNKYTFARNLHTLASSEIIPYQPISPVVSVRQAFGGGID